MFIYSNVCMYVCARYFAFLEQCAEAKACTVLLRGGSKDVLNEIERNLTDAMQVSMLISNMLFSCDVYADTRE